MKIASFVKNLVSGDIFGSISKLADELFTSDDERNQFKLALEQLKNNKTLELEKTVQKEMDMRASIINAEMSQGDKFTKRARPSLVYFGLLVIFYNYCVIPTIMMINGTDVQPFELPFEFWAAWGGVVGIWSGGRTVERLGFKNKTTKIITGRTESLL